MPLGAVVWCHMKGFPWWPAEVRCAARPQGTSTFRVVPPHPPQGFLAVVCPPTPHPPPQRPPPPLQVAMPHVEDRDIARLRDDGWVFVRFFGWNEARARTQSGRVQPLTGTRPRQGVSKESV